MHLSMSTYLLLGSILPNLLIRGNNIDTYDEESFGQHAFIFAQENENNERLKREDKMWGPWEAWSPCSVSCGEGRSIKYRHCISDTCGYEEKEAQIRPCHMKPCKTNYFSKDLDSQEEYVRPWVPI